MKGKAGRFSRLAAIDPASLAGLTGWWDASDPSTLFDNATGGSVVAPNGEVGRIIDQSGNFRHFTQDSGSLRPLRKTAIQNNLDVVRFDGINDRMVGNTYASLQASSASSIFIVANAKTIRTDSSTPSLNEAVFSETFFGHGAFVLRSGNVSAFGEDSEPRTASVSYTVDSFIVLSSWHEAGSLHVQTNQNASASVALGTRTFTGGAAQLGTNYDSSEFFDGDLGEMITYNVALSEANRNSVISYLMDKWGI